MWLTELNPKLAGRIMIFPPAFESDGGCSGKEEDETTCLFCGQTMTVCAHCFSRDVYEQIVGDDAEIGKEFLERFDFDLRRELVQ